MLPPEQEPPTTESAPASGTTQSTPITTPASGNEGIELLLSFLYLFCLKLTVKFYN